MTFLTNLAVNENIKSKIIFADNHFHNILRLSDFYQVFFSPQVERCTIITYKHGI